MEQSRTCKNCGFLTIDGSELTSAERVMLGTYGESAVMPKDWQRTDCFKRLWVENELAFSETPVEAVIDQLKHSRENCREFLEYRPKRSPEEHLKFENEIEQRKFQWRVAKLGFAGSLVGGLLGVLIPHIWHWIDSFCKH